MLMRALPALVLICCLGGLASAAKVVEPPPASVAEPAPVGAAAAPAPAPVADPGGPAAVDQKRGKGSGFWTSDVPTEGRPYRWTYMLIGLGVISMMGLFMFWLIRRNAGTGTTRKSV